MTYEYIFITYYLEDAYGVLQTSRYWKYGIEKVKCYDGTTVVRLLNSKYGVFAQSSTPSGWAKPDEIDSIIENVLTEFRRKHGINVSFKKFTKKAYLGVNNDKFYWDVVSYKLVSESPLSYYKLEEIKNMLSSKLKKTPLTNEVPKPDIETLSFYPEKNKADVGEPIPLHIYIVLTRKPDTKYPIKLDIRYWDKDTIPPLNMRTKWKPIKELTIYAEPGEDRVSRTIHVAFDEAGKYHIIVYACVIDECWTGTYDKVVVVGEIPATKPAPTQEEIKETEKVKETTPTEEITPTEIKPVEITEKKYLTPTEEYKVEIEHIPQPTPVPRPYKIETRREDIKKLAVIGGIITLAASLYYLLKRGRK